MTMAPPNGGGADARHGTVLVVEDEVLVRMGITDELLDAGYKVIEATTADEALSVLEAGHPVDLVFSDVHMPGRLDGIELLRVVRRRFPQIPVILTSGHAAPGEELGPDLIFVPKPYLSPAVIDLVARTMNGRETTGEARAQ